MTWWSAAMVMAVMGWSGCGTAREASVPGDLASPAPPPGNGGEAQAWVATGPDGTSYTLVLGSAATLTTTHEGVARSESLAWVDDDRRQARGGRADEISAEVDGASCVEVVGMEADAMLVRVGTVTNGQCLLSDTVLRFARQNQR